MNAERLLAHFDRAGDAPEAVPRLRRFILDLAVRGRLVEQDPDDEPASELLKRIGAEKARLVKAGKLNRRKLTESAPPKALGFELRSGWVVVRFSDILIELQTGPFGSSLHQNDYEYGGTPVINPASIKEGKIVPIKKMAVGDKTLERLSTFKLQTGDIVMGRRGELGRCAVVTEQEDGWLCGTGSLVLRLSVVHYAEFLAVLISSPHVREYLVGSSVGATMQNLNQSILLGMSVGLPPIAEQRRIVAKVDELMALCDRLEAARAAREQRRDRLAAAGLARLSAPDPDAASFRAHARFAADHLPALSARAGQVARLRRTILNLAVRGRLVEQDPDDEPASALLEKIMAEKEKVRRELKRGKISKAASKDNNFTISIPSQWAWAKLNQISLRLHYGFTASASKFLKEVRLLRITDIQDNRVDWTKVPGCDIAPEMFQNYALERGDLLIARTGGTIGKTFLVSEVPVKSVFASYLIRVQPARSFYPK